MPSRPSALSTTACISRRATGLALLALPLSLLVSCGGGGSSTAPSVVTTPTPRPPITLSLLSGESQSPLAGATVVLGGERFQADASGRLTLPSVARPGDPMDLLSPGFFDRATRVPSDQPTLTLWPLQSPTGLDEGLTRRLVYTGTQDGAPEGGALLRRPERGPVFLVPSGELREDARALAELEYGASAVSSATEGRISYQVATAAPADAVQFDVYIDTADDACRENNWWAYCQNRTRNGYIIGGKIVFCHVPALYGSTMTHEVGHAFGLFHSQDRRDMMYGYASRSTIDFSTREQLAMRLMLQRPAGNRYPDTDRTATGSGVQRLEIIGCPQ